jgi:Pre-mRNA 3'-end-processing endonuclease polyadenylation factor C-term
VRSLAWFSTTAVAFILLVATALVLTACGRQSVGGRESVPNYRALCIRCPEACAVTGAPKLRVADCVTVIHVPSQPADASGEHGCVALEWESGPHADCTADAIVAALLQEQGPPPAVGAAEEARRCVALSRVT